MLTVIFSLMLCDAIFVFTKQRAFRNKRKLLKLMALLVQVIP